MPDKFLKINSTTGRPTEVVPIEQSAGAADGQKIVRTRADGTLDPTLFPNSIGADVKIIQASEAIQAGDFVNEFDPGNGVINVRKAIATPGFEADGYVLADVPAGTSASVYFDDANTAVAGLQGTMQFLSDTNAGKTTNVPPQGAGKVIQSLGKRISATSMHVNIGEAYTLA